MMTGALTKMLGGQLLRDAQTFITAFDTLFGGFRERADATYRLLQAPGTAFLVVAAPEPDALREAAYFVERLDEERMPLAGLILNRVHRLPAAPAVRARAHWRRPRPWKRAAWTRPGPRPQVRRSRRCAAALRLHAERMTLSEREQRVAGAFTSAHPAVPVAEVAALPVDVHDLEGLRRLAKISRATRWDPSTRRRPGQSGRSRPGSR